MFVLFVALVIWVALLCNVLCVFAGFIFHQILVLSLVFEV